MAAAANVIDSLVELGIKATVSQDGGVSVDLSVEQAPWCGQGGPPPKSESLPLTEEIISLIASVKNLESLLVNRINDAIEPVNDLLSRISSESLKCCKITMVSAGDETVEILASRFSALTQLSLRDCRGVTNESLRFISRLSNLHSLDLKSTNVDDEGIKVLAQLTKLEELNLAFTLVKGPGLEYLQQLPKLHKLELNANRNTVESNIMSLEAFQTGFSALQSVSFGANKIHNQHIACLSSCTNLEELLISTIQLTDITNEGLIPIATNLTKLEKLSLNGSCKITDEGIALLVSLKQLEWLNLDRTRVTEASAKTFAQLPNLKYLSVCDTQAPGKSMEEFQSKNPNLKISFHRVLH